MDRLDQFMSKRKQGMTIGDFLERYPDILDFAHGNGLTQDIRLARGRGKRVRGEVFPARSFCLNFSDRGYLIQFPFNCGPIDCNIVTAKGQQIDVRR